MRDRIVEIGEMKENKDVNKKEGDRMINEEIWKKRGIERIIEEWKSVEGECTDRGHINTMKKYKWIKNNI